MDDDSKLPAVAMPDDNAPAKRRKVEDSKPPAAQPAVDDRKPPPAVAADDGAGRVTSTIVTAIETTMDEDSKLPAAAMPDDNAPAKRRKVEDSNLPTRDGPEVIDVAAALGFERGDKIEVKWTINDDDDEEEGGGGKPKADGEDASSNGVTVWWAATLVGKTEDMHTLTDEEMVEGGRDYSYKKSSIRVPIYKLNYAPLEEHGFDTHSLEDVAFISNKTLLNLSTEEMMIFRKEGMPSPPSSPTPMEMAEAVLPADESAIAKDFADKDEILAFMNQLMQSCLKNTGMDKRMKELPAADQLAMAERIKKAQEGLFDKIVEETDKMQSGSKVITADLVRKCMSQMSGPY